MTETRKLCQKKIMTDVNYNRNGKILTERKLRQKEENYDEENYNRKKKITTERRRFRHKEENQDRKGKGMGVDKRSQEKRKERTWETEKGKKGRERDVKRGIGEMR